MALRVLGEEETLQIISEGRSVTRMGEGELKLAVQRQDLKSQTYHPKLAEELKAVLTTPSKALACLPRLYPGMPNPTFWNRYANQHYKPYYKLPVYGSAFISRPDMANNIDHDWYWNTWREIWRDKDVILVSHGMKTLPMPEAKSVKLIKCMPVGAYAQIDQIEEEIGMFNGPIFLAAGCMATVLAVRLANKGLYALDVGHLGAFMPHAGAFLVERESLISQKYLEQNKALHARPEGYGGSGHKQVEAVLKYAKQLEATRVLDYGCGQGTLRKAMKAKGFKPEVVEYDPAITGKDHLPKPADLIVCTDVLEHVEPERLTAVLEHIYKLTKTGAYILVANRLANKILPDGRNAHLIVESSFWWFDQLTKAGFKIDRYEIKEKHSSTFWCSK